MEESRQAGKRQVVNGPILGGVRWRWGAIICFNAALVGLTVSALFAVCAVGADVSLVLTDETRRMLPWAGVVLAGVVLLWGLAGWRRLGAWRVARALERRDATLGNALSNAVQLAEGEPATAVEAVLRREAVERGRQAGERAALWPVVGRSVVARVAVGLVACGMAAGLTWWFPEVWESVWPRFADPFGDHPPFSRVTLQVEPGAVEVLYGGHVEVRAVASGAPVEKLYLATRKDGVVTRVPMFMASDRAYFQTLANVREETEYFVTDGRARSRRFAVGVRRTPRIEVVKLTLECPEYTGLGRRTVKLGEEELRLPVDSRVSVRVASNRPLESGRVTLTPLLGGEAQTVAMERVQRGGDGLAREVAGSFAVTGPVAFTVSVRDVDGLESDDNRDGRVDVLPDKRPQILVLEPGRNAVATPSIDVPVRVQAQDDYGVTRVIWFRGHNRSVERPFQVPVKMVSGPGQVEAAGALKLGGLGVQPGDEIDYFFEAVDNDPRGPNIATSRMFSLKIISEEQYQQILKQMRAQRALFDQYQRLSAWVRRLRERAREASKKAEELADKPETDPAHEELRKELAKLAKEMADWRTEMGKLDGLPQLFDAESFLRQALREQGDVLKDMERLAMAILARGGRVEAGDARQLAEKLGRAADRVEQDVEKPVAHLAPVVKLIAEADKFTDLAGQQAELARLLRRYREKGSEFARIEQMEMQELAAAQQRVLQKTRDLVEGLTPLLAQVPEDPVYAPLREQVNEFVSQARDLGIVEDLARSRRALDELNAAEAYGHALAAAQNMDKLVAKCEAMSGPGGTAEVCLSFQPALKRMLGNSLQQILAAMGARGQGEGGRDGYSLFNEQMGLYGPMAELVADHGGDRSGDETGPDTAMRMGRAAGDANDPRLALPGTRGRVMLQRDVKFPLHYRDLVGEYFRVIAEEDEE